MEWKTFGIKRRLVSARHKASNLLRLIGRLGRENPGISSATSAAAPHEPLTPLTDYSLEAELKKAQALAYWRRWQDRPK